MEISYGPGGVSRGIATISFTRPDAAAKAVEALNGLLVDGKPMKVCSESLLILVYADIFQIDVILDARRAAAAIPAPKGLSERIV